MKVYKHKNDLPEDFLNNIESVAVDSETMGLLPYRDRLCLSQFSKGDGVCHIVQFENFENSPNIINILLNEKILKIFHYARFDVMVFYRYLGVMTKNIYCTNIASKLCRTYTSKHSLLNLCSELLNIEISKEETCTDWGNANLTQKQLEYAVNDVLYLHKIKNILDGMLIREDRIGLAQKCFDFLEARVLFDLMANENYDIFSHGV